PARALALRTEDAIGPTALRSELRAHALGWQHRAATETGSPSARHRADRHILLSFRFEDVEHHAWRLVSGPLDPRLQRPSAVRLLAQPERAHERDFGTAVRCLALYRACPEVGDGRRSVGLCGVNLSEFLFRPSLDLCPNAA